MARRRHSRTTQGGAETPGRVKQPTQQATCQRRRRQSAQKDLNLDGYLTVRKLYHIQAGIRAHKTIKKTAIYIFFDCFFHIFYICDCVHSGRRRSCGRPEMHACSHWSPGPHRVRFRNDDGGDSFTCSGATRPGLMRFLVWRILSHAREWSFGAVPPQERRHEGLFFRGFLSHAQEQRREKSRFLRAGNAVRKCYCDAVTGSLVRIRARGPCLPPLRSARRKRTDSAPDDYPCCMSTHV